MQTNIDTGTLAPPLRALFEGQQAALEALRAEVASLTEQNRRLDHLLNELRRAMFGKKSEKLHPDQLLLAFEELEGALAEVEEQAPANTTRTPCAKRRAAKRNIGHLPAHLPRDFEVIEPESTQCSCGCGEMARIGADRTERLDIIPARLRVIVTVRPRYACRLCEQGVTQAPAPAHLIEGAIPTEGAIAHGPVSKFADHLPLYRQSQILARSDIELHRSTLAGWIGKASFHLRPVYDRLTRELKTSDKPGLDETTVRVLDPGRGKTKTGYMWTMVRDERARRGADPPGCVYAYAQPRRQAWRETTRGLQGNPVFEWPGDPRCAGRAAEDPSASFLPVGAVAARALSDPPVIEPKASEGEIGITLSDGLTGVRAQGPRHSDREAEASTGEPAAPPCRAAVAADRTRAPRSRLARPWAGQSISPIVCRSTDGAEYSLARRSIRIDRHSPTG